MRTKQLMRLGLALFAVVAASEGHAAASIFTGTSADTRITNTATATYDLPGSTDNTVDSNETEFFVDEVLDVAVAAQAGNTTVAPGDTNRVVFFDVRNTGNGTESMTFTLSNLTDDFQPAVTSVVVDANGNDAFNDGVDTVLSPSGGVYTIPSMTPGQILRVFVRSTIPGAATDGQFGRITLTASPFTAFDNGQNGAAAGTVIDGAGDGTNGIDAIIGTSTATDDAFARYLVTAVTVRVVKTIDLVEDPFGNSFDPQTPGVDPNYVPGATVTYRLEVFVEGSGTATNLRITDDIAGLDGSGNGVLYVADSVIAVGNTQTDESGDGAAEVRYVDLGNNAPADDTEQTAANLDGGVEVFVDLGDIVAVTATDPAPDVITFQVVIQ